VPELIISHERAADSVQVKRVAIAPSTWNLSG